MSWKLFGQIVLLIIITAVVLTAAKCFKKSYCPMYKQGVQKCQVVK